MAILFHLDVANTAYWIDLQIWQTRDGVARGRCLTPAYPPMRGARTSVLRLSDLPVAGGVWGIPLKYADWPSRPFY